MTTTLTREYLQLSEAARLLGVSRDSVRVYADRGQLECLRTPAGRLVSLESVERMQQARAQKAARVGAAH